jgi:hypothetical protein
MGEADPQNFTRSSAEAAVTEHKTPAEPTTPAEWQAAVDAAEGAMHFSSVKAYGLVKGGPAINEERCIDILRRGAELGYRPDRHAPTNFMRAIFQERRRRRRGGK